MVVLTTLLGIVAWYPLLHVVGIIMLALVYGANAQYNQYKVSRLYAIKWILITGLPGCLSSGDEEDGLFWRHIQKRMDADRTNAYDIAECAATLRRLKSLPRTSETVQAISAEKEKLGALRAHDNEVTAAIGVSVLAPDLAASQRALEASHYPSNS